MTEQEMTPELSRHIEVEQQFSSEVYDAHPEIGNAINSVLLPRFESHPETVKILALTGESGIMKGTVLGQGSQHLEEDSAIQNVLKEQGKKLRLHYFSTASMVKTGIALGLQTSSYGSPSPEEIRQTSMMGDRALKAAEEELPLTHPDETHLILEELVGVDDAFDVGTSIIKRQGASPDALVIFCVSNPQIQERTYRLRKSLWDDEKDQKRVLASHDLVLDMEGDKLKTSMGTHKSIELITSVVNKSMYESYRKGEFTLPRQGPNRTPWELLRDYEFSEMSERELETFFSQLTTFSDDGMKTHPLRPYVQTGYYHSLAEKWGIMNPLVLSPTFVDGTIHGYPEYLDQHALDLTEYLEPERIQASADIFVRSQMTSS